ncbi:phosphatidylserine decarboxylase-like protein [Marasmius fiardii PR-910]|nr:phosphatidylserine decarboxylase-like protein [Marasmius fiardii PR-910]
MSKPPIVHHRVGGWLPKDHRVLQSWLDKKLAKAEEREKQRDFGWHPVIQEFQQLIENNADLYMDFHAMFEQVPTKPPYNNDPTGKPQVRNYMKMLSLFDLIIQEAPECENIHLVGFPINAILDWPMGTQAGLSAFMKPKVNEMFKKMFDIWATFLSSRESCYVLTTEDHGWFSPAGQAALPDFDKTFICDPSAEYHGFTSWDDFFTRRFRPGVRPVFAPDDDRIINAGCESTIYAIKRDIRAHDRFWLKGKPYSLYHILGNDEFASQFVGGTIFQAFLSALNYHRWHSPVNGTIVKTVNIPGTYYAESPAMAFPNPDPTALDYSQGFLTQVATRALIFIECDNPDIGLMCFVAVGMVEVSTNEVTVREGQRIKKGDQLGMFHFGGSTHCLIFRSGVNLVFNSEFQVGTEIELNAYIATVKANNIFIL